MSLYGIDKINKSFIIECFICLEYNDAESITRLFEILNINYNFNPLYITTDFSLSQIKAIKNCKYFNKKPCIVPFLFHFA